MKEKIHHAHSELKEILKNVEIDEGEKREIIEKIEDMLYEAEKIEELKRAKEGEESLIDEEAVTIDLATIEKLRDKKWTTIADFLNAIVPGFDYLPYAHTMDTSIENTLITYKDRYSRPLPGGNIEKEVSTAIFEFLPFGAHPFRGKYYTYAWTSKAVVPSSLFEFSYEQIPTIFRVLPEFRRKWREGGFVLIPQRIELVEVNNEYAFREGKMARGLIPRLPIRHACNFKTYQYCEEHKKNRDLEMCKTCRLPHKDEYSPRVLICNVCGWTGEVPICNKHGIVMEALEWNRFTCPLCAKENVKNSMCQKHNRRIETISTFGGGSIDNVCRLCAEERSESKVCGLNPAHTYIEFTNYPKVFPLSIGILDYDGTDPIETLNGVDYKKVVYGVQRKMTRRTQRQIPIRPALGYKINTTGLLFNIGKLDELEDKIVGKLTREDAEDLKRNLLMKYIYIRYRDPDINEFESQKRYYNACLDYLLENKNDSKFYKEIERLLDKPIEDIRKQDKEFFDFVSETLLHTLTHVLTTGCLVTAECSPDALTCWFAKPYALKERKASFAIIENCEGTKGITGLLSERLKYVFENGYKIIGECPIYENDIRLQNQLSKGILDNVPHEVAQNLKEHSEFIDLLNQILQKFHENMGIIPPYFIIENFFFDLNNEISQERSRNHLNKFVERFSLHYDTDEILSIATEWNNEKILTAVISSIIPSCYDGCPSCVQMKGCEYGLLQEHMLSKKLALELWDYVEDKLRHRKDHEILWTLPVDINEQNPHTILNTFENFIEDAKASVMLASPWLSPEIMEKLKDMIRKSKNIKIKIITSSDKQISSHRDALQLLEQLKKEYEQNILVGIHNESHAKLLLVDKKIAIVSSANYTLHGLKKNREIGVLTKNFENLRECESFFDEIWKEAKIGGLRKYV